MHDLQHQRSGQFLRSPIWRLALWGVLLPSAPVQAQAPVVAPSFAEVETAYRAYVDSVNAENRQLLGAREAQRYQLRLLEIQALSCEFHSGQSYRCRVMVSTEATGRVSRNRGAEVLMTPAADGWKFRLLRRPR